jgi:hypothetical protein
MIKKLKFNVISESKSENANSAHYARILKFFKQLDLESTDYFINFIGSSQIAQKEKVKKFQNFLLSQLALELSDVKWKAEHLPVKHFRDAIDIYGINEDVEIIIELDKPRADQVSKKFLSRNALFEKTSLIYIAVCYPGTKDMPRGEIVKYFEYCNKISERLENNFLGILIES